MHHDNGKRIFRCALASNEHASSHLYKRLCPSVCPSVCWSVIDHWIERHVDMAPYRESLRPTSLRPSMYKYEKKAGLIVIRMVKTASFYDDSFRRYIYFKFERGRASARARRMIARSNFERLYFLNESS